MYSIRILVFLSNNSILYLWIYVYDFFIKMEDLYVAPTVYYKKNIRMCSYVFLWWIVLRNNFVLWIGLTWDVFEPQRRRLKFFLICYHRSTLSILCKHIKSPLLSMLLQIWPKHQSSYSAIYSFIVTIQSKHLALK